MIGTHADPATPQRQSLALVRGAALSGRVLGDGDAPLADARAALVAAT
jgi:hypothetical protein